MNPQYSDYRKDLSGMYCEIGWMIKKTRPDTIGEFLFINDLKAVQLRILGIMDCIDRNQYSEKMIEFSGDDVYDLLERQKN